MELFLSDLNIEWMQERSKTTFENNVCLHVCMLQNRPLNKTTMTIKVLQSVTNQCEDSCVSLGGSVLIKEKKS